VPPGQSGRNGHARAEVRYGDGSAWPNGIARGTIPSYVRQFIIRGAEFARYTSVTI
jgi:hypothetical protein